MVLYASVHPKCMTRLGRCFQVSHQTLRSHFDKAKCHTGDLLDCTNLVRGLCQDLSTLQELIPKGGPSADVLVDRFLPVNCTERSTGSYCLNCGLVGKPSTLNTQHYTDNNKKCSLCHLRTGTILKSSALSKIKIPEEVVGFIRQGKFVFGEWKDPKEKRMSGRLQSIIELSCQASDNKLVSLVFFRCNSIYDVT